MYRTNVVCGGRGWREDHQCGEVTGRRAAAGSKEGNSDMQLEASSRWLLGTWRAVLIYLLKQTPGKLSVGKCSEELLLVQKRSFASCTSADYGLGLWMVWCREGHVFNPEHFSILGPQAKKGKSLSRKAQQNRFNLDTSLREILGTSWKKTLLNKHFNSKNNIKM